MSSAICALRSRASGTPRGGSGWPSRTSRSRSGPGTRRRTSGGGWRTKPPDILITTPESLFLLLTSQARETLRSVQTVIIDEVHAMAGGKRGAHLALSLERLDALRAAEGDPPPAPVQRIGLSATVRPPEEVASFLGGALPVTVVAPPSEKQLDADDRGAGRGHDRPAGRPTRGRSRARPAVRQHSIWPHVEERVLDLIQAHRSTIVFANSRRLAERLCARLNELAAERAEEQLASAAAETAPGRCPRS